jgi:agmatinase
MKKADVSKFDSTGAGDARANIFGLNFAESESNIVIIPVPWEVTVSYLRGTAKGPAAVRGASAQLDLFDAEYAEMGLARPWEFGIHLRRESPKVRALNTTACKQAKPVIAAGGPSDKRLLGLAAKVNEASVKLNAIVGKAANEVLSQGKIVGVLGGDHSTPFGAIAACAERFPGMGILHFDAHADLREAFEGFEYSHASIMNNVVHKLSGVSRLVQLGIRDFCDAEYEMATTHPRIQTWFDHIVRRELFQGTSFSELAKRIVSPLPEHVYVSFDIDGLDPSLCPHTGTPVAGGLQFAEAVFVLRELAASGRRIVGFDLNEVAPHPRNRSDEWDGNVGARILYKLCAAALYSSGART